MDNQVETTSYVIPGQEPGITWWSILRTIFLFTVFGVWTLLHAYQVGFSVDFVPLTPSVRFEKLRRESGEIIHSDRKKAIIPSATVQTD